MKPKTNQKLIRINGTSEQELFSHIVLQAKHGSQKGLLAQEYINNCTWRMDDFECTVLFIRLQGANERMTKHPLLDCCFLLSISFDSEAYNPGVCKHIEKNVFGPNYNKSVHQLFFNKDKQQYFYNSRLFVDCKEFKPIDFNEEILEEFKLLRWVVKQ